MVEGVGLIRSAGGSACPTLQLLLGGEVSGLWQEIGGCRWWKGSA
jgi:hypothetical protein